MKNSGVPIQPTTPSSILRLSRIDKWRRLKLSLFILLALVPIIWASILSIFIARHGIPGFRVTPVLDSFVINTVDAPLNPVQKGDRIKSISGISYYHFLNNIIHPVTSGKLSNTVTIERSGRQMSIPVNYKIISWYRLLQMAWPNFLLIIILSVCGLTAVLLSPPGQPSAFFFTALVAGAMTIASQISFDYSFLDPDFMSSSFISTAIGNWLMFSAWAHYCLNFPSDRQLLTGRPWMVAGIYILPPAVAITTAYIAAGPTMEFWGWLQRVRRWSIPFIIFGTYGKHLHDFFTTRSQVVKNQLKVPLSAVWIGLGPYVFLYLIPSLALGHPLITFRLVVMSGLVLPLSFLYVMIRYRLLEIDEAISNSLAYFVLILAVYILYAIVLSLLNRALGFQAQYIIFPFLILVIFILNPARKRLQFVIDRVLFPNKIDLTPLLQPFSQRLTTTSKIDDLAALLVNELPKIFKIEHAALEVLRGGWRRTFSSESCRDRPPRTLGILLHHLTRHHAPIFPFQSQSNPKLAATIADIFEMGYVLILGLKSGEKLVGVLFLGIKLNNRMYTDREIRALITVSNLAALAIENSLNFETLTETRNRIQKMYKKMVRSEKLANIGETASMLAHEIKNPLAIIRSSAQFLVSAPRDPETRRELLEYIVDEVDTLNLVFSNMLGLSGYKNPKMTEFDLADTLNRLLDRWESGHDHNRHIVVVRQYNEKSFLMTGDEKQLSQMLINLIRNGEEAIATAGFLYLDFQGNTDKNLVKIIIRDTGTGIAEENTAHVFRKFFTTKKSGLGLGLPLCQQIIKAHNGTLSLENDPDQGAIVTVCLPSRPPTARNKNLHGESTRLMEQNNDAG